MLAFGDHQADLVAIDLHQPDRINTGRTTSLIDQDGVPRSTESVGGQDGAPCGRCSLPRRSLSVPAIARVAPATPDIGR